MSLEVPPGDPVLGADDAGVRAECRTDRRGEGGDAVRLEGQEDDLGVADRGEA